MYLQQVIHQAKNAKHALVSASHAAYGIYILHMTELLNTMT